jgi:peptidoglycan hydrolase-like protein with peptidoglycan-binding domain
MACVIDRKKEGYHMRSFSLLSFAALFLWGCVTAADVQQTTEPPAPPPAAAAPAAPVSEKPMPAAATAVSEPSEPLKSEPREATAPVKRSIDKEKIQVIQELLNTLGFDAGPIDGVLGSKTRAALVRFQSGCAVLKEVLGESEKEILQQAAEPQAPAEESRPAGKLTKDRIRAVQERLKQAGFDPGPIDGVMGAKTREALEKYQASHGLSKSGALDAKTLGSLGIEI